MTTKPFDLVVFGATSFVGQILTRYLFEEFGLDDKLRWAAAGGRSGKLEELRKFAWQGRPPADAHPGRCRRRSLVAQAVQGRPGHRLHRRPVCLYGEPLVRICAGTGTDYCDLTGEVQWMRRMIHLRNGCEGLRRTHCAQLRLRLDSVRPWRALPAAAGTATLRPALHRREDARPQDARRFLRRHRRLAAERPEGGRGGSGPAQGTRGSVFDLPPGQRSARPPAGRGARRIDPDFNAGSHHS